MRKVNVLHTKIKNHRHALRPEEEQDIYVYSLARGSVVHTCAKRHPIIVACLYAVIVYTISVSYEKEGVHKLLK